MNMQLSKTPIGLDGIPAAETVLSHVDGERGELIIAGERVGDLARKTGFEGVTARLWSGGTGQPIGEAAVRARLGAGRERAFARLPDLLRHYARPVGRRRLSRARSRACARKRASRMRPRIVGAFPVIAGALVQRVQGQRPDRARSNRKPCRRYAVDDARPQARRARGRGAGRLFRHGVRSRHERIDLHDARGGVDAGGFVRSRHRRLLRADGPLHGGAPEPVLEMLDAIGSTERISRGSTVRWPAASG